MNEKLTEPVKKVLTAEEFLDGIKPKAVPYSVPGLGDIVIRGITLAERDEIRSASVDGRSGEVIQKKFLPVTLLKGVVEPKLSPAQIDDLMNAKFGVVADISNAIWKLSGDIEAAKNA